MTSDVRERLKAHNAGQSVHTANYRPWELTAYIAFRDDRRATAFEKYPEIGFGPSLRQKASLLELHRPPMGAKRFASGAGQRA